MIVFQCSVVNFPLLTAALKEYASDSAIDLVKACFHIDFDDRGDDGGDGGDGGDENTKMVTIIIMVGWPWG